MFSSVAKRGYSARMCATVKRLGSRKHRKQGPSLPPPRYATLVKAIRVGIRGETVARLYRLLGRPFYSYAIIHLAGDP